jgi:hypothetical protein
MTTSEAPETPAVTPEPAAPAAEPAAVVEPPANEDPQEVITRLEAEVKAARAEAGKARINAKATAAEEAKAELAKTIGKALGLVTDEPIDPAKLTEQVSAATAEANRAKVELAVFHAAAGVNADATALLDSRSFMASLADIDPADKAAVTSAIAEAIKANPAFAKPDPTPKPTGKPVTNLRPGAAPSAPERAQTLAQAVAAHYQT